MILQSDNPVRMVCELKGAKLSILILLGLVKQPVSQEWLERNSGYTDKPVSQALQYLQEHGLVLHSSSGWLACKDGQQLMMGLEIEEDTPSPSVSPQEQGGQRPSPNKDQFVDEEHVGRNNSDSLNYLSTVVVEEDIKLINSTTTNLNLSEKSGKIPTAEEIQMVLDAVEGLFGHSLMGDVGDYADIDRLLSWVAKAYDGYHESGKSKIFNPIGMIYWAFHGGKNVKVEKKYQNSDWYNRQPEWHTDISSFMRASGQWEFKDEDEKEEDDE